MAAKPKTEPVKPNGQDQDAVLNVLTVSEFSKLTDDEKQVFRACNGTVTNDPI